MVGETNVFEGNSEDAEEREHRLLRILDGIEFPKYEFILNKMVGKKGRIQFFLQLRKKGPIPNGDNLEKELSALTYYAVAMNGTEPEQEVVRAVFEQIQALETHEVAELFHYCGERVYYPHRSFESTR